MIHLVIDTTAFRNDPARKKAAFRSLKRLAEAGEIRVHVPHVVMEEFLSQQIEQYVAGLSEIRTLVVKFKKKHVPDVAREVLDNTDQQLNRLKEELVAFARTDFDQWVRETGAEVHGITESHGKRVIDAYFSGALPFREKKRREDIPDAFIWQVVLDLVESLGEVHVVSGDGAIKTASEAHASIVCFGTVDEFIASDTCQTPLRKNLANANFQRLVSVYPQLLDEIRSAIDSEAVDILAGKTVTGHEIPDDNNEATITMIGEPEDIEMSIGDTEYFGDGLFVVPVTFTTECLLSYAIFKSDLYGLPDDKIEQISISDLNDHYYDAEEDYVLTITASVAVNLKSAEVESEEIGDERLAELADEAETSLDSVEEIEVPSGGDY
jgi:hypothetical protein